MKTLIAPKTRSITPHEVPEVVTRHSPWLLSFFRRYIRCYLARHFHAVRLSRASLNPNDLQGPLIVVLNHPSWWDPLMCAHLTSLFGNRSHFAPMDAAALERYRFFARLGFFGIEPGSVRGAATFLRTSLAVLVESDKNVLWITAQGKFTDPRCRPVKIQSGVGHLANRLGRGVFVPLALEYPFWQERTPEALAHFGPPMGISDYPWLSAKEWTALIEDRLENTQDELAEISCARNERAFRNLLRGKAGIGGPYDWWRKMRAYFRGERFDNEHGSVRKHKKEGVAP